MKLGVKPPVPRWIDGYNRTWFRSDLAAGLTVGAMLVPQAMAYALLAGLPPEVGLYASTVAIIAYAMFGTSRQLAVGPVAIVSLITATALGKIVEQGTTGYVTAAAVLAVVVGLIHLVMGFGRLGFLVNLLSHSVLVGFTAAAAIIIGFSQVKHLLGISPPNAENFLGTVEGVVADLGSTNGPTFVVGFASLGTLFALKRWAKRWPGALVVVIGSIVAVEALDLGARGVKVVGDIPGGLPAFAIPGFDGSLVASLAPAAIVITIVGFMESIAVAKVYARRHRYDVDPNQELIGLGVANMASGLFGGYPVTGGFSRTAVNESAGARTPLASLVTAAVVLATIAFLTPLFRSLPNAALGAIIIAAVVGLVDVAEMRHIAAVKRSDLVGLGTAFVATLVLGIEIGIGVAVVASMLVVFARISKPHTAVLGHVPDTTTYRNVARFDDAKVVDGAHIVRIDAALSFVNADYVKKLVVAEATQALSTSPAVLVLDASGMNDIDATGAEALNDIVDELEHRGVQLHLSGVKGPVRDVLQRCHIWDRLPGRIHASTHDAVQAIAHGADAPHDLVAAGIDERRRTDPCCGAGADSTSQTCPQPKPEGVSR